jgi:hypothetical protein
LHSGGQILTRRIYKNTWGGEMVGSEKGINKEMGDY